MAKRSFPGQLPSYPVFPWGILKANKESEKDLTGYDNPDILEGQTAINWWKKNKEEVEKNLAEQ
jgi:hypothetical protein